MLTRTMNRPLRLLGLAPILVAGCAGISGGRPPHMPRLRTITSVGDKPLTVVAGAPGESVRLSPGENEPNSPDGLVSGRVVDRGGQPVPDAEVRVAFGGNAVGRVVRTKTDEAGGFTLRGLRPNASYTLVAETETLVGQQVVEAPARRIRIALDEPENEPKRRRVSPASESVESDDEVNPEDLPDSQEDADFAEPPASRSSPWRAAENEAKLDPDVGLAQNEPNRDDEEVNPLPPAIERPEPTPTPDPQAPTPDSTIPEPTPTPLPDPPGTIAPAPSTPTPDPPPVIEPAPPIVEEAEPEPEPGPPAADVPPSPPSTTQVRRTPTWGEVMARSKAPASAPTEGAVRDRPGPIRKAAASCDFDRQRRRLNDFQMPDLLGRPLRFRDLDADLVLLDFWGTSCGPCLDAMPHMMTLQKRFGDKKLRVVGVAYDDGPLEGRAERVAEVSRRLKLNYPVVLAEADSKPCPLQAAFEVNAYPTMVLLDRQGRVLWRGEGAGPRELARLDRAIAGNALMSLVRR